MDQALKEVKKIVDEKYLVVSTINSGINSQVKLVENLSSSKKFAMKLIKNKGILYSLLLNDLQNEIRCLKQLNDENIIKIIDFNLQGELIRTHKKKARKISYVVLEYAENGELFKYLKKSRGFPLNISKYYFKQILLGVSKLHNDGIFHRDLKLENLLLDKDFKIKIADFGFATNNEKDTKVLGTDFFMAPEMISRKEYFSSKCDVFSLGVILFTFIKGNFPFKSAGQNDINYKFFASNKNEDFWKIFGKNRFSIDAIDLLNKLFSNDPFLRPTVDEILSSAFLNEGVADENTVLQYMKTIKM
jgi:serine/threonine protein kinase